MHNIWHGNSGVQFKLSSTSICKDKSCTSSSESNTSWCNESQVKQRHWLYNFIKRIRTIKTNCFPLQPHTDPYKVTKCKPLSLLLSLQRLIGTYNYKHFTVVVFHSPLKFSLLVWISNWGIMIPKGFAKKNALYIFTSWTHGYNC